MNGKAAIVPPHSPRDDFTADEMRPKLAEATAAPFSMGEASVEGGGHQDNDNGNGAARKDSDEMSSASSMDFTTTVAWDKTTNIYANQYKDTSKRFRGFWHLMRLWKGSVMKLVWHDLVVFLLIYFALSLIYREVLFHEPVAKEVFELICIYCSRFRYLIPITFLTGFYVTQVVSRYWDQFMTLPYPDRLALKLVSYIPGKDSFRRNLRRTVMRYVNLSIVLVFRLVSQKVNKRFPTTQSLIEAKLLLKHEAERLTKVDHYTPHESTWAPMLWALKLVQRARTEGKIVIEAPVYASLVSGFDFIEESNRKILNYGWVNFPLAYTQVATISVFLYFTASLFGAQYLKPGEDNLDTHTFPHLSISFSTAEQYRLHTPDLYVPFFTIIEFISYMGWIKVAETLLNPFGDDDEDFQINYLIDRNLQVSYMIVDNAEMELEVAQDPFLEAGIQIPEELPYQEENQRDEASKTTAATVNGAADETDEASKGYTKTLKDKVRRLSVMTGLKSAAQQSPSAGRRRASILRQQSGASHRTVTSGQTDNGGEGSDSRRGSTSTLAVPAPAPAPASPPRSTKSPPSPAGSPSLITIEEEGSSAASSVRRVRRAGVDNRGFIHDEGDEDDFDRQDDQQGEKSK